MAIVTPNGEHISRDQAEGAMLGNFYQRMYPELVIEVAKARLSARTWTEDSAAGIAKQANEIAVAAVERAANQLGIKKGGDPE